MHDSGYVLVYHFFLYQRLFGLLLLTLVTCNGCLGTISTFPKAGVKLQSKKKKRSVANLDKPCFLKNFKQAARSLASPSRFESPVMSQCIPPPPQLDRLPTEIRHMIIQYLIDECFGYTPSCLSSSHNCAVGGLTALARASHILRKDVLVLISTREARLRRVIRAIHSSLYVEETAHCRVVHEAIYCMSLGKAIDGGHGPRGDSLPRRHINRRNFDLMSLVGILLAIVGVCIARAW